MTKQLIILMSLLSVQSLYAQEYELIDLGVPPRSAASEAYDIGHSGHIVGLADPLQAVLWFEDQIVLLPTLGGDSFAYRVNAHGDIVGGSQNEEGDDHAVLWQDGQVIDLGTLPEGTISHAVGINDAARVVGAGDTATGVMRALLWHTDSTVTELPSLCPDCDSEARAINNADQIVGSSGTAGGSTHAVLWEEGQVLDLGALSGDESYAYNLNERGHVVGAAIVPQGEEMFQHAFMWRDGHMQDLGTLGGTHGVALDINWHDRIVGSADAGPLHGGTHAFIWRDGEMFSLNDLTPPGTDWHLIAAHAINDAGMIVGLGFRRGFFRAFLLIPSCPADLNGDGAVGITDLMWILAAWGPCPPDLECPADLDGDGQVNTADVMVVLADWGVCGI